ncbi:hypothetical protein CATMIT_01612, partial [Catenibacterium mitsuokai DSM 15897]
LALGDGGQFGAQAGGLVEAYAHGEVLHFGLGHALAAAAGEAFGGQAAEAHVDRADAAGQVAAEAVVRLQALVAEAAHTVDAGRHQPHRRQLRQPRQHHQHQQRERDVAALALRRRRAAGGVDAAGGQAQRGHAELGDGVHRPALGVEHVVGDQRLQADLRLRGLALVLRVVGGADVQLAQIDLSGLDRAAVALDVGRFDQQLRQDQLGRLAFALQPARVQQ